MLAWQDRVDLLLDDLQQGSESKVTDTWPMAALRLSGSNLLGANHSMTSLLWDQWIMLLERS
jgi:hypothetical protein